MMKNSRVKSVMDIPHIYRRSSHSLATSESVQDIYFDISFFDDSSAATSSTAIQSYGNQRFFDTSSELSAELENYSASFAAALKSSQVSFGSSSSSQVSENEGGSKDGNKVDTKQHRRYKSLLSVIKILKNFSMGLKSKPAPETSKNTSIYRQLRRPREYIYVKGMSGLSNRIEKASTASSSSCRYAMRSG